MKEQPENKNSEFLKTDRGRTAPDSIEIPSVSLPKGGGALKGIDEKFSVNTINGTAAFSVPLPFSPARELSPSLNLSYNSGGGNGIFGLGWSLSLSSIKRKTDKELPRYIDSIDSDTYLFSEAEDLVPEFLRRSDGSLETDGQGDYILHERTSGDTRIRYYKPRIEGLFARIERHTDTLSGEIKWKITTRDNVSTLYGWSSQARIADPEDQTRIFEWLPEFTFDDKGNCVHYLYKKEDKSGLNEHLPHNRNRVKNSQITYTNCYLSRVLYGNKTPYTGGGNAFPGEDDFLFVTAFDFGEYDAEAPESPDGEWDYRPDAFSEYRAGFEIRTTRLCKRVLLFHRFMGSEEYDGLVKSLRFSYDTSSEEDFSFLKSITLCGHIKKDDGTYSTRNLPPMEFAYEQHHWNSEIRELHSADLPNAPAGIDEKQYLFTDLFSEGLPGILSEQSGGWYYKQNMGDAVFEAAERISSKPSFSGLGNTLRLTDLEADGNKQLVSYGTEYPGFFELSGTGEWQNFRAFQQLPNINFNDRNTRMLDLNGDGRPEVLISEDRVFTWYPSEGRQGFSGPQQTPKAFYEEDGPHILFSDAQERIFLADMSGDGLTDIVRIRHSSVCYWPNLGYGRFGAKVTFDDAPVLDQPDAFNTKYIQLADIDGSGTADIIYLGRNKFSCWKNLSGNRFSTLPFEIDPFPEIHAEARVNVTDLLGNGISCIVWSSPLPADAGTPLKYIDLMNSRKPHIMVSYKNNMGREVSLEYTPSTRFYLEDKKAGRPWITKLHFPVHCISRMVSEDKISGQRLVSEYRYRHGYYDHPEREFRGFGMVEQTDTESFEHWKNAAGSLNDETLYQEPVISRSWVHTGAFTTNGSILNGFRDDYWQAEMLRQGFLPDDTEAELADARISLAPGLDPALLQDLTPQEWQEALRACKSMKLRTEVFARDAAKNGNTEAARIKELSPYSVSAHNCIIELIQPRGKNKHAVFVVKESEAITYNYERNTADPRVSHQLNLRLDEYGNVLESASVVYRRLQPDLSLPAETRSAQDNTVIIYTGNLFTEDAVSTDAYRLRLPAETQTFELRAVPKTGNYYKPADLEDLLTGPDTLEIPYHEWDSVPPAGKIHKRLIEHVRTVYYRNNLSGPLALYKLESRALRFESFQLAYTPALLSDVFGTRVNAATMAEGRYTHSEGDDNWWVRSGTTQYLDGGESLNDAADRFFMPVSYTDPNGAVTRVRYQGNYFLLLRETEDAFGNRSGVEKFNFRTLSPRRMYDINGNLSEVLSDELGIVKAIAAMGKGNEADELDGLSEITDTAERTAITDFFQSAGSVQLTARAQALLKKATTRFVYDLDAYTNSGAPAVVASIGREEHYAKNSLSPVQIGFEYSGGSGEVLMKKTQAEPGMAKQVTVHPDNSISISETDTSVMVPAQLRWIGNGRIVKNNKGNPVKQYEPYFSVTHRYESYKELVETGVTPLLYYDAPGRLVKTLMPDDTFTRRTFDNWQETFYDASDTAAQSAWYQNRSNRLIDAELLAEGKDPGREKIAADKAVLHSGTPNVMHLDTLGRPVLSIDHNRNITTAADEYYDTRLVLDTEGNLRLVKDARGNPTMRYRFDMLGNLVYQQSMDAGQRWRLLNIFGKPLRTWDERDHEFRYFYDALQRPRQSHILGGDGSSPLAHIFERILYGEDLLLPGRTNEAALQALNVLGQPVKHYDTGGLTDTPEYDFKGKALQTTRKLFRRYKETADWTDMNLLADLESESFSQVTELDALSRITQQTAPDGSIITFTYNETGLLKSQSVQHAGSPSALPYLKDIQYNEKKQREKVLYGNDVSIRLRYDKKTFRLLRLQSERLNGDPLQDWHYTYDPSGNITHIEDKNVPLYFFDNQKTSGISEYTYDALYRLAEAKGRENEAAFTIGSQDNWNDEAFMHSMSPGDPMSIRNYTQRYVYDAMGNILQMQHIASGNNWTRDYTYATDSNRLQNTKTGAETYTYQYHAQHGYMTVLPHLEDCGWNFKEELRSTVRQKRLDGGTAETTWYQYDGQGKRLRKITENQADSGVTPTKKEERIYIDGYELYKKHSGAHAGLERVSLSLMDEGHRFVMTETRNAVDDGSEKHLVRYQLHNHIGSAALELDHSAAARVISYEEYHPFGTTAYQARNSSIKAAAKRYRYTGMERDEESGLSYHSARYYLPWLGRWMSTDPIGIAGGMNIYAYSNNNPLEWTDTSGKAPDSKSSPDVYAESSPPPSRGITLGDIALGILLIPLLPLTLSGCSNESPPPPPKPSAPPPPPPPVGTITGDHVIIAGATSVNDPEGHDLSAVNFMNASANRAKDIKKKDPSAKVTVIMFSPENLGYQKRATTAGKSKDYYEKIMKDSAARNGFELIIVRKVDELNPVLNTAKKGQVKSLEYFGHSNATDLLLEYSSDQPKKSTMYWGMQKGEVSGVRKDIFSSGAEVNLYGCDLGDPGGLAQEMKNLWDKKTTASDTKTNFESIVGNAWKPKGNYIELKKTK